jgi:serine/threonine protein kinase
MAETVKAVDPLLGHIIDSKYQLIEQLGKGGMGVVYRAERVLVGDDVALKILRAEFVAEEETVQRFRREARAAAKLRHPNIVTIYDYGEARGADAPAYIVMELLDGVSLRELLRREGRLKPERALQLMRGICAGIGLAHRREIVHRDIKPDNIILLPPDEEAGREHETVKVVDFGIAKLRDAATGGTLTQKGFQPGTSYYMSPEQCRGDALDARSDVYSLGALLYEMLAGAPPFVAETHTGVISKQLFDTPTPLPTEVNIAPTVEAVVMRALAKEPDARPADAGALAGELKEAEQRDRESQQRREEEERQRVESERLQTEEAARRRELDARREAAEKQREQERLRQENAARLAALEEGRRAEEQRLRASHTQPSKTEHSPRRPHSGPQRESETDPTRTQRALIKPALADGSNFVATEPESASRLGVDYAGDKQKRGGSKVWIVLGVLAVAALAIWLSFKLSSSNSSTDRTKDTTNSSPPASAPSAIAPNFKPLGNPYQTQRNAFKIALSPDGKQVASTDDKNDTSIIPIMELVAGHRAGQGLGMASSSVAISPVGNFAAFGGEDVSSHATVVLYNLDGNGNWRDLAGHKDYVFIVAFTPDNSRLISASADKTVRVWNVASGQQDKEMQIGKDELIITIDPNQMRVAIFSQSSGQVRIRSINDPAATSSFDNRHAEVTCGAFSPNGETLALGTSDGKAQLWSIPDGTFIRETKGATTTEVGSVAFTPDGQYLAIGWNNGDIELRRTSDGSAVQTLKGHTRVVRTLSFSRDGHTLASGAEDKTIRLWQY